VLCSCGSGNGGAKKFDEDVVKEDRTEYKEYVKLALEQEMYGDKDRAVKYYEAALELEMAYNGTEYAHWFNSDAAGKLDELLTSPTTGTHEGHEWVDLGLSVKWATCNVGASTPGDYGNYYAWGETSTKREYTTSNCASIGKSWGGIGGNSSRDAARANWGGSWRMPTKAEVQELKDNCTWTRTTQNGHKGYKVTSKKNGQNIFLPTAGYRFGDTLFSDGEYGYFWSSTPSEGGTDGAYGLNFGEDGRSVSWCRRNYGRSVRPVLED
jgi:uncharacterized protein (TIGR02145 family)